jgi:hypothetical protein
MHEYEIRIFRSPGSAAIISAEIQLNDNAAIRSARKLAEGRTFEVWRGMNCIYGLDSRAARNDTSPDRPAA